LFAVRIEENALQSKDSPGSSFNEYIF